MLRVASNTIYRKTDNQLGNLTADSMKANNIVSTGKVINEIYDDPVGLSQTMNLKTSLSNVGQLQRNISIARTWLNGSETAIGSIKQLVEDAKVLCIAIKNGSLSEKDRAGAADQISGYIHQIRELSNTKINGAHIFAGSKTTLKPYEFDNDDYPNKVFYRGDNKPFSVKNGEGTSINVGHNGQVILLNKTLAVDDTNNKLDFVESKSAGKYGPQLTAKIPKGRYSPKELASLIEAAMEDRSRHANSSEILNVSNIDAKVKVLDYNALRVATPEPHGTQPFLLNFDGYEWSIGSDYYPEPRILHHHSNSRKIELDFTENGLSDMSITFSRTMKENDSISFEIKVTGEGENAGNSVNYDVSYNEHSGSFSIKEDSEAPILNDLRLLWQSGSHSKSSIGPDLGFDVIDLQDNIVSDIPVTWPITISTGIAIPEEEMAINEGVEIQAYTEDYDFTPADSRMNVFDDVVIGTYDKHGDLIPKNDQIIFTEDTGQGRTIPLIANLAPTQTYSDDFIGREDLALDIQNKMRAESYENGNRVDYIVSYNHKEERFVIDIDSKSKIKEVKIDWDASSAARILGFDKKTDIYRKTIGEDNVEWGVFRTLLDLRDYLKADDSDGINRSMTRLESDFENLISIISAIGNNELRLDIKDNIIEDLNVSYETNKSAIEDAEAYEAISNFQAKEGAYKSALATSSRVMKVSLVDYIR